jgi:LmbE family N-acetylglucosaminyl deacetylase
MSRISRLHSFPSRFVSRRDLLALLGLSLGPVAFGRSQDGGVPPKGLTPPIPNTQSRQQKTLLAVGAHYDDCVFGIPGILLQAAQRDYRIVVLSLIGDYSNWKPVRTRTRQLIEGTTAICRDYGTEARFLDFASMRFEATEANKRKVAEVVSDVQPDIAFMLWPLDHHADHEIASAITKVALRQGDRLLPDPEAPFSAPQKVFLFDNGPQHTIDFEPNVFVDVTEEWPRAIEWLGRLMALVRNEEYDPQRLDGAQRAKEALARYRGTSCRVPYAEALVSAHPYPQEIF